MEIGKPERLLAYVNEFLHFIKWSFVLLNSALPYQQFNEMMKSLGMEAGLEEDLAHTVYAGLLPMQLLVSETLHC